MRHILLYGACILAPGSVVAALVFRGAWRNPAHGTWNRDAIRATLERVVSTHNDVSFIYVLENRTDADYRIEDESEVKIFSRSRSTGDLVSNPGKHLSGEFPLLVPGRRKVHFARVDRRSRY
jgi:hypothetical protein